MGGNSGRLFGHGSALIGSIQKTALAPMYSVVLDTNVVISALRSRRGASFAILRRIGDGWVPLISVPLLIEYEAVGKREAKRNTVHLRLFAPWRTAC